MRHLSYNRKVIYTVTREPAGLPVHKQRCQFGTQDEVPSWFETFVGLLQGCVLSPLPFIVMLEVVMAIADSEVHVSEPKTYNLRFADDLAILADE